MRSKLKLSRSLELISAFSKEQQVINTRGAPPPPVLIGLMAIEKIKILGAVLELPANSAHLAYFLGGLAELAVLFSW